MAEVLHFSPDGDKIACGERVFLCDEYTDEPRYVDCRRCRRTKMFRNYDPTKYNVDVWDHEGDIVAHERRGSYEEALAFEAPYEDDPTVTVVIEQIARRAVDLLRIGEPVASRWSGSASSVDTDRSLP